MVIETFSFNTKSGLIELHNVNVNEIVEHLAKKFPNWSKKVCETIARNKSFYKQTKPLTADELSANNAKRTRTSFKTPILVNGVEINPMLRLAKEIKKHHKNGFGRYGVSIKEMFDNWDITPSYNTFERKFDQVEKMVKKNELDNIREVANRLAETMYSLKTSIEESGVLKKEKSVGLDELIGQISNTVIIIG